MGCCGGKTVATRVVPTKLADTEFKGHRRSCLACACKHLAQARALLLEAEKGYPPHYWFAMGHMAEAEDECLLEYPKLAKQIRESRLALEEDPSATPNFESLIEIVDAERLTPEDVVVE